MGKREVVGKPSEAKMPRHITDSAQHQVAICDKPPHKKNFSLSSFHSSSRLYWKFKKSVLWLFAPKIWVHMLSVWPDSSEVQIISDRWYSGVAKNILRTIVSILCTSCRNSKVPTLDFMQASRTQLKVTDSFFSGGERLLACKSYLMQWFSRWGGHRKWGT